MTRHDNRQPDTSTPRSALARTVLRKLTPPEVARRYGVSHDKVLSWIRSGELRAVNITTTLGGRPRYVIDEVDLAAFEARRAVGTTVPANGKRRKRIAEGVIEFF
jgi:excisionase family DNA binding protein